MKDTRMFPCNFCEKGHRDNYAGMVCTVKALIVRLVEMEGERSLLNERLALMESMLKRIRAFLGGLDEGQEGEAWARRELDRIHINIGNLLRQIEVTES